MNRAEAEAVIRSIERRCRGPLSDEHRDVVASLLAQGKTHEAQAYDNTHRGIPTETPRGTVYAPCNYNVNDLICAGPIDGLDHTVQCPRCKVVISYRPAWFPELPEEERKAPE